MKIKATRKGCFFFSVIINHIIGKIRLKEWVQMKVAAYIRTATNTLESYRQQLNAIHAYCEGKGHSYELYEDIASSGHEIGTQLLELINNVNEYDLIVTESVERLTRNYSVFHELKNTFRDKLVILN